MVALTDPRARRDGAPASLAEIWLSDLAWHKHMYRPVRYRWDDQDAIDLISERGAGRLDFSTVEDLYRLDQLQQNITGLTSRVHDEMASRCVDVVEVFSVVDLDDLAHLHETTVDPQLTTHTARTTRVPRSASTPAFPLPAAVQVAAAVTGNSPLGFNAFLTRASLSGQAAAGDVTNDDTDDTDDKANAVEITRALRGIPLTNPLTEVWELEQLLGLCEAAEAMLEDTTCDLLAELTPTRPAIVLAHASGATSVSAMQARIASARRIRGAPGDDRRLPQQHF